MIGMIKQVAGELQKRIGGIESLVKPERHIEQDISL
jgi:hypothetical protein